MTLKKESGQKDLTLTLDLGFLEKELTLIMKKTAAGITLLQDKTQQLRGSLQMESLQANGRLFIIRRPIKAA